MSMEGMGNMSGGMMGAMNDNNLIEWEDTMAMMNRNSTNKMVKWILRDDQTGKEGMDINWTFKK